MNIYQIKRALRGKRLTFVNVENILQSLGYSVVLFNTYPGDMELERYGLEEKKGKLKAFTYSQTAHIILGHIDKKDIQDARLMEMEADAFAYQVLYPQKDMRLFNTLTICFAILCIILGICFANDHKERASVSQTTVSTSVPTAAPTIAAENQSDIVYVTPSGTKYHRSDCRYVKNKNCSTYTRAEAEKKYSACSVCRP